MGDKPFNCFHLEQAIESIATSLGVAGKQVRATVELLDAGNAIPFIARDRKEVTKGLDEMALREIEDSLTNVRKLAERKSTILKTIDQQGVLTDELRGQIEASEDKKELENLYLPFKPKRRTRATIARGRGLEPLAEILMRQEQLHQSRSDVLRPYVSPEKDVPDEEWPREHESAVSIGRQFQILGNSRGLDLEAERLAERSPNAAGIQRPHAPVVSRIGVQQPDGGHVPFGLALGRS